MGNFRLDETRFKEAGKKIEESKTNITESRTTLTDLTSNVPSEFDYIGDISSISSEINRVDIDVNEVDSRYKNVKSALYNTGLIDTYKNKYKDKVNITSALKYFTELVEKGYSDDEALSLVAKGYYYDKEVKSVLTEILADKYQIDLSNKNPDNDEISRRVMFTYDCLTLIMYDTIDENRDGFPDRDLEGEVIVLSYNDAAARGIIANMINENATLNPSLWQNGKGPGFGLCQWEVYDDGHGRGNDLLNFCLEYGLDSETYVAQFLFMDYEMRNSDKVICNGVSLEDGKPIYYNINHGENYYENVVENVMLFYEGPANPNTDERRYGEYTKIAMNAIDNKDVYVFNSSENIYSSEPAPVEETISVETPIAENIASEPVSEPLEPEMPYFDEPIFEAEALSANSDNQLLNDVIAVIRGDYGNMDQRREILGDRYEEVQRQVDLNINDGHWGVEDITIYE